MFQDGLQTNTHALTYFGPAKNKFFINFWGLHKPSLFFSNMMIMRFDDQSCLG